MRYRGNMEDKHGTKKGILCLSGTGEGEAEEVDVNTRWIGDVKLKRLNDRGEGKPKMALKRDHHQSTIYSSQKGLC